jgi:hypothetical protein
MNLSRQFTEKGVANLILLSDSAQVHSVKFSHLHLASPATLNLLFKKFNRSQSRFQMRSKPTKLHLMVVQYH